MEDKINVPHKGLYTDNSSINQPEGTYSFALNAVTESNEGDFQTLSNENSNEIYAYIKPDYVIIGSVYIGDGETCIFSVKNDNSESEIGILSDKQSFQNEEVGNNYKTLINDSSLLQDDKLKFKVDKQIQATYRLRKGCEKVVYWVDNNNETSRIDINHINNLIKDGKKPTINDFRNFNVIRKIPIFKDIEILDSGGFLPPGAISVYIQYLDKDLNPTAFLTESNPILIYHDSIKSSFSDINGSTDKTFTGLKQQFLNYGLTTKSIRIVLDNLDTSFTFYKLGFVLYSDGTKIPSNYYLSDVLSIKNKEFVYTGKNHLTKATREDFSMFLKNIDLGKSKTILQKDNRLIIGNVNSGNLDFRNLQKLASKIKTDCVLRESIVNSNVDKSNSKSPYNKIVGTGFQPGDIYSLGIVYVFEGNLESPVFHIPGKNRIAGNSTIYDNSPKEGVLKTIGMIAGDSNTSTVDYLERYSCNNFDFWGLDCEGLPLKGNKMRFHRFPTRQEANTLFYEKVKEGEIKDKLTVTLRAYFEEEILIGIENCKEGSFVPKVCVGGDFIDYEVEFVKDSKKPDEKAYMTFSVDKEGFYETEELPIDSLPSNFKMRYLVFKGVQTFTRNKETKEPINYENFTIQYNDGLDIQNNNFTSSIDNFKIPRDLKNLVEEVTSVDGTTERVVKHWELLQEVDDIQFIGNEVKSVAKLGSVKLEIFRTAKNYDTDNLYKTTQFGLHFSNVELPEPINGKKCIGYYIVAEERNEESKTILDSGYVLPTIKNKEFNSLGLWTPLFEQNFHKWKNGDDVKDNFSECMLKLECSDRWKLRPDGISDKTLALVSPKILFKNEEFNDFNKIEEQISFKVDRGDRTITGLKVQNVLDHQTENIKDVAPAFKDTDGTSLKCAIVTNKISTENDIKGRPLNIVKEESLEKYPLKPYYNTTTENKNNKIFNLDMVNHYLFLHKNEGFNIETHEAEFNDRKIPYVYIKNEHNNFYTKRNQPYYRITDTIQNKTSCTTFNGDSYVGALRLHNFVMDTPKGAFKCKRDSIWDYIAIGAGVIVSLLSIIFTAGASLPLVVGIGTALLSAGVAVLGVANIIEKDKFNQVFGENWFKGLNMTIFDDTYHHFFFAGLFATSHKLIAYQDDTIPFYCQVLGDLFFESDFNFSLRIKPKEDKDNYLEPFKPFQYHNQRKVEEAGKRLKTARCTGKQVRGNMHYFEDNHINLHSESPTEKFFLYRLCDEDESRSNYQEKNNSNQDSGYKFKGMPMPVLFFKNDDYSINKKLFSYYEYPIEYSFCSDCVENFPQRFYWSEVSNSESLTDNYKIFLPNNYKDLNGEYGNITNMFSFNNNLYIHTEEGLWIQPTNYQERITDGIVSYIGTGEFGSLPAQLIVDDRSGTSAGLQHREAQILTPYGYFFVSERERKIYKFDGKLTPISDLGMSKWFNENIPLELNKSYRTNNGQEYIYNDNPSNKLGTGFILTYDKERERILVTKKDYIPNQELLDNKGYELCTLSNNVIIFLDIKNTIKTLESKDLDSKRTLLQKISRVTNSIGETITIDLKPEYDYNFVSTENCEMKFESFIETTKELTTTTETEEVLAKDTIFYIWFDKSGSFNAEDRNYLRGLITSYLNTKQSEGKFSGEIIFNDDVIDSGETQRFFLVAREIKKIPDYKNKNIVHLSFTNESTIGFHSSNPDYHSSFNRALEEKQPSFIREFQAFKELNQEFKTGSGSLTNILYPMIYDGDELSMGFMIFLYRLMKGRAYTEEEINTLYKESTINGALLDPRLKEQVTTKLKADNPYSEESLYFNEFFNVKTDIHVPRNQIKQQITLERFTNDLDNLFQTIKRKRIITETKTIKELKQIYIYVPGTPTTTKGILNNGWTLSYSLKTNTWISFHSYIPNFYFRMNNKHFSWVNGNKNIYKHNKPNHFQEFYESKYPYIVEYVSNDNPIVTKIFDHIRFLTEAYKYDKGLKEYYNERFITFNKAVLYNSRQCSGELNLRVKDITPEQEDYLKLQIINENNNVIFLDRNEKDWLLNDFRDYRTIYNYPIWSKDKQDINTKNNGSFIDKVLNEKTINMEKSWYDLESFRDKYLVVRLSFDNFASDIKLLFNFSSEDKTISNY